MSGQWIKRDRDALLANVWVKCEVCEGKRYDDETLQVKYKDKSICDVLEMDFRKPLSILRTCLELRERSRHYTMLVWIILNWVSLRQRCQAVSTKSQTGKGICRASTGKTLYILDEPTTGMHFADTQKLLDVLNRLVDVGNTVVVIETTWRL